MTDDAQDPGAWALVALTIAAAPAALALETLLRWLLFPPEMEALREIIGPTLTWVCWGLLLATALVGALSLPLFDRAVQRAVKRVPEPRRSGKLIRRKKTGAFMLVSSLPQIPVLLATVAVMLGASIVPTALAVVLLSGFLVLLGRRLTASGPGVPETGP